MGLLEYLRKSTGKRTGGASGVLGAFNELYNPSAHSAQMVLEEKREALKPKPAPTDKDLERLPLESAATEETEFEKSKLDSQN